MTAVSMCEVTVKLMIAAGLANIALTWPLLLFMQRRRAAVYAKLGSPHMWTGGRTLWAFWTYLWKLEYWSEPNRLLCAWYLLTGVISFVACIAVPILLVAAVFLQQCVAST